MGADAGGCCGPNRSRLTLVPLFSTKPVTTGNTAGNLRRRPDVSFECARGAEIMYGCTATISWTVQSGGGGGGGGGSVTVQIAGTPVGTNSKLNFSGGAGIVYAISSTGSAISIQSSSNTAVTPTLSSEQAGGVRLCASASGSATTYSCAMSPTLTLYTAGMILDWKPDVSASGGATTLNVDFLGATPVKLADGVTNPGPEDILTGRLQLVWFDGAAFRLLNNNQTTSTGVRLCASASGSATTYTCAGSPTLFSYTSGMILDWKPDVTATGGAITLNVDSPGATAVKLPDGVTNPAAGDLVAGRLQQIWFDGTVFRLITQVTQPGVSAVRVGQRIGDDVHLRRVTDAVLLHVGNDSGLETRCHGNGRRDNAERRFTRGDGREAARRRDESRRWRSGRGSTATDLVRRHGLPSSHSSPPRPGVSLCASANEIGDDVHLRRVTDAVLLHVGNDPGLETGRDRDGRRDNAERRFSGSDGREAARRCDESRTRRSRRRQTATDLVRRRGSSVSSFKSPGRASRSVRVGQRIGDDVHLRRVADAVLLHVGHDPGLETRCHGIERRDNAERRFSGSNGCEAARRDHESRAGKKSFGWWQYTWKRMKPSYAGAGLIIQQPVELASPPCVAVAAAPSPRWLIEDALAALKA